MPYPNLKQSVWLMVLLFLYQIALIIPITIIGAIFDYKLHEVSFVIGILTLVSCGLIMRYVGKKTNMPFSQVVPIKSMPWKLMGPILITIIGLSVVISLISNVMTSIIPMPESLENLFHELIGKKTSFFSAFFMGVIQAPVTEEILFRSVILSGLLATYSQSRAILWSALLFGIFHMNPWQFPIAFLLGLMFAWWVVKTNSLLPALIGHALHNFIVIGLTQLDLSHYSNESNETTFLPWWVYLCGAMLTWIGIRWFNHMTQKNEPLNNDIVKTVKPELIG